jgi:hypothetical protein
LFAYCCYATTLREVPEVCLSQTKTFPVYKNVLKFQNEYNKVEIELRVVQFWTEIKLVITNRTPASRSCDFVITRLISVQIALHSVQLPLYIKEQFPLTYLLEVLCRGVQDRMFLLSSCIQDICWIVEKYPARFRVLFKYINVFF